MHVHDIERMLGRAGYVWARSSSSHHIYRNPRGYTIMIAAHGKRTFSAREIEQIRRDMRQQYQQQQECEKLDAHRGKCPAKTRTRMREISVSRGDFTRKTTHKTRGSAA